MSAALTLTAEQQDAVNQALNAAIEAMTPVLSKLSEEGITPESFMQEGTLQFALQEGPDSLDAVICVDDGVEEFSVPIGNVIVAGVLHHLQIEALLSEGEG